MAASISTSHWTLSQPPVVFSTHLDWQALFYLLFQTPHFSHSMLLRVSALFFFPGRKEKTKVKLDIIKSFFFFFKCLFVIQSTFLFSLFRGRRKTRLFRFTFHTVARTNECSRNLTSLSFVLARLSLSVCLAHKPILSRYG